MNLLDTLRAGASVLVLAACGAQIRPHASDTGTVFGGVRPTLGGVDTTRFTSGASGAGSATVQTVCRASGVPAAWVAVDYVEEESCPATAGERFNGAIVVRHSVYRKDAELLVCADQRIPNGWRREGSVDDPAYSLLCQSSRRDAPVSERVIRITKR